MTERGQSPPDGGHNMVGAGAGHKVSGRGKGCGYARSSHHEGLAGPRDGKESHGSGGVHTGYHTTDEHKGHGSAHKLPMEHNVPFRKGIAPGDHFEAEVKEHFPNNKGIAGINKTAMPQKSPVTPSEAVSHSHGHASGKAEHHNRIHGGGESMTAHVFKNPQGPMSHGYGHDHEQKSGFLRLSGHKSAHRIGARGKRG